MSQDIGGEAACLSTCLDLVARSGGMQRHAPQHVALVPGNGLANCCTWTAQIGQPLQKGWLGVHVTTDDALRCVGYARRVYDLSQIKGKTGVSVAGMPESRQMMPGKVNSRDVVQRPDGTWAVTKPGAQRASAVTPTQGAAADRASTILHNDGGGELRIHGTDGKVRDQRTIAPGNDPYPPPG